MSKKSKKVDKKKQRAAATRPPASREGFDAATVTRPKMKKKDLSDQSRGPRVLGPLCGSVRRQHVDAQATGSHRRRSRSHHCTHDAADDRRPDHVEPTTTTRVSPTTVRVPPTTTAPRTAPTAPAPVGVTIARNKLLR